MRNMMMKSAGMLSAIVLAIGASGCGQPMSPQASSAEMTGYHETTPSGGGVVKTSSEQRANTNAARARAEARAAQEKEACERARQNASNRGAVIGGVGGAVIGSQVAGHGAKTEGSIIGGLAGVLTGRQVAKKNHRC